MNIVSGFISDINVRQDRILDKYLELGRDMIDTVSDCMSESIPDPEAKPTPSSLVVFLEKHIHSRMFSGDDGATTTVTSAEQPRHETWWYRGKQWNVYSYATATANIEVDVNAVPAVPVPEPRRVVVVIEFEKSDLYLAPYRQWITQFSLTTKNPAKDTLDYCLVQLQKMEWMRMAVNWHRCCHHQKDDSLEYPFVWMDFGIRHMYSGGISHKFREDITNLIRTFHTRRAVSSHCIQWDSHHSTQTTQTESTSTFTGPRGQQGMTLPANGHAMRFGHCPRWTPDSAWIWHFDLYKNVAWLIAGSVFAGDAATVETFAGVFYEKCLQIIAEKGSIMWEVNVFAVLFGEQPQWFSFYSADHNPSLVRGLA